MAETLALAVGVPAALGAAWLASRRSWSSAHADNRGIALQTVIVIVVMLVIAGGVAGVLLSRGSEVTADLQNQEILASAEFTNESTCDALFSGGASNSTYAAGPPETCTYTGTSGEPATSAECIRLGGTFSNADHGTCELTRS